MYLKTLNGFTARIGAVLLLCGAVLLMFWTCDQLRPPVRKAMAHPAPDQVTEASARDASAPAGIVYRPLALGDQIVVDFGDPDAVRKLFALVGYVEMTVPRAWIEFAAKNCANGPLIGIFYDFRNRRLLHWCADQSAVTAEQAEYYCELSWERRQALLAEQGIEIPEPRYTVLSREGSRVVCQVGSQT
jgi:hypothetical protein